MSSRVSCWVAVTVLASAACTARAPGPPPPIDCSVEDGYELLPSGQTFEPNDNDPGWYPFGDCTVGRVHTATVESIENGGRCGSTAALVLRSSGHHDWGSGFGTYEWRAAPQDATGFEGISFWARSPGATDKGVLVNLGDDQTEMEGGICFGSSAMDAGPTVEVPIPDAGGETCSVRLESDRDAGAPPQKGQCGNAFVRSLIVSEHWQFYRLPFDSFVQVATPNRVDGINPSAIHFFGFNMGKDSRHELWIDDIGFYRRKPAGS